MGVSLEVYRCRIGLFQGAATGKSAPTQSSPAAMKPRARSSKGAGILVLAVCLSLLLIGGIEPNPGPALVECKICHQSFSLAVYAKHYLVHSSQKNSQIPCTFPGCSVKFATLPSFKTHVSVFHRSAQRSDSLQTPGLVSICPVEGCSSEVNSREEYLNHMPLHLRDSKTFVCLFEGCATVCFNLAQFRSHVSNYHPKRNRESCILKTAIAAAPEEDTVLVGMDDDDADADVNLEDVASSCGDEDPFPDNLVKDEMARFYLELEAEQVLPTLTVQVIAERIKMVTEIIHHKVKRALREEMKKVNINDQVIDIVVGNAFLQDPLYNVHHKGRDAHQLGTNHLRTVYWQDKFRFINPERKYLGISKAGKEKYAHLIPVKKSLSAMLLDEQVKLEVQKSFARQAKPVDLENEETVLQDFTDGSYFHDHVKEHHNGEKCIQIKLFQDAFDPNAFGSGSGIHKPLGFYWTLGNLPSEIRNRLDLIQLAYMVLEKDLKPTESEELEDVDKLEVCLKPLLDSLKDVVSTGIEFEGETVPVCLFLLLGDSLGQNHIGGFVRNFSSCEFWCRFCPVSKTDFLNNPFDIIQTFRTAEDYDVCVNEAKAQWLALRQTSLDAQSRARAAAEKNKKLKRLNRKGGEIGNTRKKKSNNKAVRTTVVTRAVSISAFKKLTGVNVRGVKYRPSPFNSPDLRFHVVGKQPPCLHHDLAEGVIKTVVPRILHHFIEEKKWFDLPCLNDRIAMFHCKGVDALDRPKPLKSLDHLSGNAIENMNFLRLLPFIIGDLIKDKEDPYWCIYLLLKEICEYVCAPRISVFQVRYLGSLVGRYLAMIKEYLSALLTPKHHFLSHYAELILLFGPLVYLSTLRFESKHAFFKRVSRTCRNFINITFTMSRKYMCRNAFDRTSDLIPPAVVYESPFLVDIESLPPEVKHNFPVDDLMELNTVSVHGTKYSAGLYMLLGSDGTSLQVGCINKTFLRRNSNEVLFMLEEKKAVKSFDGYFIIQREPSCLMRLKWVKDLPDYTPLQGYSFQGNECISLKYACPFMQ